MHGLADRGFLRHLHLVVEVLLDFLFNLGDEWSRGHGCVLAVDLGHVVEPLLRRASQVDLAALALLGNALGARLE